MSSPKVMFIDLANDLYDLNGVYSLSSCMKQNGIDVYFARGRNTQELLRKIGAAGPELLLYSSVSSNVPQYIHFDRIVKERLGIRSLIGGPGPTYDSGCIARSTIDAVCVGEGEAHVHSSWLHRVKVALRYVFAVSA